MNPAVSICIPVFGPQHFLDACLKSIEANTPDPYEIRIVDNGTGHPVESSHIQYLRRNVENVGYAVATNQAAKGAKAPLLCLLNVDTEVQSDWLGPMLAAFHDPQVAAVGPRIIHPNGVLQTSGIRTWRGGGSAGGEELKGDGPSRDVDGVTGACMVIRTDVFHSVGSLCDQYKNGYEDVDLCLTLRDAGWRIRYVAESTIVHHESATGPERWQWAHANVALMNQRWGNR